MPPALKINVQVDRLPDVTVGENQNAKTFVQVALRVSAAFAAGGSEAEIKDLKAEHLLPWQWGEKANEIGTWRAHETDGWALWRLAGGTTFEKLTTWMPASALVTNLAATIAAFDSTDPRRFLTRVEGDVAKMVSAFGTSQVLQEPGTNGVLSGQTVFGLVETLTALPHPAPVAFKVTTVLSIDPATLASAPADTDVYLAVPLFAAGRAVYTVTTDPAADNDVAKPFTLAFAVDPADGRPATALIHPSLPAELLGTTNRPERLLDLSTFLVKNRADGDFEASDWTATIAGRIAETINPAARLMAVLDDVVHREALVDSALQTEIDKDIVQGQPDRLRTAINALHVPTLAPRARFSRVGPALAAALLEAAAVRNRETWAPVAPLLWLHAATETAAGTPVVPAFQAVTRARIAAAAGLAPTPERLVSEDSLDAASTVPTLEADVACADWLITHWSKDAAAKSIDIAASQSFRVERPMVVITGKIGTEHDPATNTDTAIVTAEQSITKSGVIALSRIDPAYAGPLAAFVLIKPQGAGVPQTIEVRLESLERGVSRSVRLTATDTGMTVTGPDGQPATVGRVFANERFEITLKGVDVASGKRLSTWGVSGASADDVDLSQLVHAGRLALVITSDKSLSLSFQGVQPPLGAFREQVLFGRDAHALRSAQALTAAGPVVSGLMSGFLPIHGKVTPKKDTDRPIAQRLPDAIGRYVDETFPTAFADAAKAAGLTDPQAPLRKLFDRMSVVAIADAKRLAHELIPPSLELFDRVTADAPPLAFLIDQLQDFNEEIDLWERLAGAGVLIGRDIDPDKWWSLNAATLHTSPTKPFDPTTAETDAGDSAVTIVTGGGDWRKIARVNPVPLVVGEINGVRGALVRYESQSIVGAIFNGPFLAPPDDRVAPRRPEAFLFPTTGFAKLPPLTFGRMYSVVPYVIGHGGTLPVALRNTSTDPLTPKVTDTRGDISIPDQALKDSAGASIKRSKIYSRTVPIAPPRISARGAEWPSPIADVQALADDLPQYVSPITLRASNPQKLIATSFFLDREQLRGTISARRPVEDPASLGLRIEFGSLAGLSGTLTIEAWHVPTDGQPPERALSASVDLAAVAPMAGNQANAGLRVQIVDQTVTASVLKGRDHIHADDLPEELSVQTTAVSAVSVASWRFAFLRISATAAVDLEPPRIQWGAKSGTGYAVDGAKPHHAPEIGSAYRKVSIFDGIRIGARTGRIAGTLMLRRPAASLSVYDRWINGVISAGDADDAKIVAAAIDRARDRATAPSGDRSLDDPAVEALFVEVVQRFPRLQPTISGQRGPRLLVRIADEGLDATKKLFRVLGLVGFESGDPKKMSIQSPECATVTVQVSSTTVSIGTEATFTIEKGGKCTLTASPGTIFELRIYGAVPAEQKRIFASAAPAERCSAAVRANFREVTDDAGGVWFLGAPLTQTIEVATELMPELRPSKVSGALPAPPFSLELARPPRVGEERLLVRVAPEAILAPETSSTGPQLRYMAARFVNRMAVLDQHWSWRGRPHPDWPFPIESSFGTHGMRVESELERFFDQAFLGRRDDDIGPPREVTISRHHLSGGRDTMDALDGTSITNLKDRPLLLEKDLNYRGGTNLWRLALRAKSRYAAMRSDDPSMVRFSHLRPGSIEALWWPLVVPDCARANRPGRQAGRPGLMLVLPLTEPTMRGDFVPPLLAVFNEEMFPLFNAGDGIEAVIEVARHPFIADKRIDRTKVRKNDPTKTYGVLLDSAWQAVKDARAAFDKCDRALEALLRLDAPPSTPQEVTDAEGAQNGAKTALQQAAGHFGFVLERGEAWGRVARLTEMVKKAKEEEDATTGEAHDRATAIRLRCDAELADAATIATALEDASATPVATRLLPSDPKVRYFQETAPDPLYSSDAFGNPLAIRVDGPIGYTADLETEAGRFDHASLLISPVAQRVPPGTFMKVRFRRTEVPELMVSSKPVPPSAETPWPDDASVAKTRTLGATPFTLRLSSSSAMGAKDGDGEEEFSAMHEGLAIDVSDVRSEAFPGAVVAFVTNDGDNAVGQTTVRLAIDTQDTLQVSGETERGKSAVWSLSIEPGSVVHARLVISQRPKPNGAESYQPVGDLAVRIRVERAVGDGLRRDTDHTWLSVLCLPITTSGGLNATDTVKVAVSRPADASTERSVTVRPIRLSDFTPGVWCQFAAVMSRLRIEAHTVDRAGQPVGRIQDFIDVSAIVAARKNDDTLSLDLAGLRPGEKLASLALRSETDAEIDQDGSPQLEEPLYAIVTRFITDAFDRVRERPIGIHTVRLPGPGIAAESTLELGERVWPEVNTDQPGVQVRIEKYVQGMKGRVRFLRVLRGRTVDRGGFESKVRQFPQDFFGSGADANVDEPFDAPGLAMGISRPIAWS